MNPLGRVALIGAAATALFAASAASAATAAERATVREEANLRVAPTSTARVLAQLPAGAAIDVVCWSQGEPTYGADKYGSMWLYTSGGGWIHSRLVSPVGVSACGGTVAPILPNAPAGEPQLPNGPTVAPLLPGRAYQNCDAARAAGPTPLTPTSPGYGPHLDRDNDGLGCEWRE